MDEETVRQFYRRLSHQQFGLTELVAIDSATREVAATGFFDREDDFAAACRAYSQRCDVYAGRNPRPFCISGAINFMNIVQKKRARDKDLEFLTALSLDIDPLRKRGTAATTEQRQAAIGFALDIQWDTGGCVDDSGNGAYLWIPFRPPIGITADSFARVKKQCEAWQARLRERYRPQNYGLRIDGCFDFSRLKRVIGTFNHRAERVSGFVKRAEASDRVREEILAVEVEEAVQKASDTAALDFSPAPLPTSFKRLLRWDVSTRKLWESPDPDGDTSRHDWMVGQRCLEAGITSPKELAAVLMNNPNGKYRRDFRVDYVERTVGKLIVSAKENAAKHKI